MTQQIRTVAVETSFYRRKKQEMKDIMRSEPVMTKKVDGIDCGLGMKVNTNTQ